MPGILTSIHITNYASLVVLLVLWIVLFKCAHILVMLLRQGPRIGWAISPLGVTIMFLHEPSLLYIWLNVFVPALVSGGFLYIGLFTALSPVILPARPLSAWIIICCGILITSTADFINALRDLRHPLWGEARILHSIHVLRAGWAKIHFTPFGYSYLSDHFGSTPNDLLQAL